jgi:hypothetical protein
MGYLVIWLPIAVALDRRSRGAVRNNCMSGASPPGAVKQLAYMKHGPSIRASFMGC